MTKVQSHVMLVLHNETAKCDIMYFWTKIPNVTKIQSHVMLVLYNVMMIPSNVKKEIKEPPNVTKVQLHVMLILYNVRMVSSNVREK